MLQRRSSGWWSEKDGSAGRFGRLGARIVRAREDRICSSRGRLFRAYCNLVTVATSERVVF